MSTDSDPASLKRRRLLLSAAGVSLAVPAMATTIRYPGAGPTQNGSRAASESLARLPLQGIVSATPLQDLHGSLTPSDLHFERHHGGVPRLDPDQHELFIHGMLARSKALRLADLKRLPAVTRTCFIECSGNYITALGARSTPQVLAGLTSQSEWTGVLLSTLLRALGVSDKAKWLLAEGADGPLLSRSIPMDKALDDAMIAYAQNGEAIRPEQGYPFRLLLPGWEGNTQVKWLRRIEVSDAPFMTREETARYTDVLSDGRIRQFSFTMDARSIITSPTFPQQLEPGPQEIRGIAWSGRGRIRAVEVSTDGGRRWQPARLDGPVLPTAHTRFHFSWYWDGQATVLQSRAIDETGYVQPTLGQLKAVRDSRGIPYHFNPIIAWHVQRDGQIRFEETG